MKLSDVFRTARDSLTRDTWARFQTFEVVAGRLCMCAHGAVQAIVNPKCKAAVGALVAALKVSGDHFRYKSSTVELLAARSASGHQMPTIVATGAASARHHLRPRSTTALATLWKRRPSLTEDMEDGYGSSKAHYLMGLVGLTPSFNDHSDYDLVIAKFDECIAFAEEQGV